MARPKKLPEGMRLRGKTYYAWFRAHGRLVQKRLSTDFRVACELLRDLRARADKAEFDILDNDFSIAELKRQYLRHCEQSLRPRTVERYKKSLDDVLKALNAARVNHINADAVMEYRREQLAGGKSPRSINMDVGALSTMLRWGVRHRLIATNPIAGVKPLANDNPRKQRRALTAEEVKALLDVSPPYLLPVWRMFMTTGIRRNELVELRFSDIDFERREVTVRGGTAKNHRSRTIPLDDATWKMLKKLRDAAPERQPISSPSAPQSAKRMSRDHVFVTGANTPWKNNLLREFYRYCEKAGIEGAEPKGSVDIHSLRVTFTTLSIDNGASPKAVQAILGHSTLNMTMGIYAKATDRAKRDAVAALPFAVVSPPAGIVALPNVDRACTEPPCGSQTALA